MRTKTLPVVLFAAFITVLPTAGAQESDGQIALPEGGPPELNEGSLYSGPYEVTADGDLIYGGDVVYRCEDLPRFAALAKSENGGGRDASQEASLEEAIGLCARAGFPPEGASAKASGGSEAGALPNTGGVASPLAELLVVAVVLGAVTGLALRTRR